MVPPRCAYLTTIDHRWDPVCVDKHSREPPGSILPGKSTPSANLDASKPRLGSQLQQTTLFPCDAETATNESPPWCLHTFGHLLRRGVQTLHCSIFAPPSCISQSRNTPTPKLLTVRVRNIIHIAGSPVPDVQMAEESTLWSTPSPVTRGVVARRTFHVRSLTYQRLFLHGLHGRLEPSIHRIPSYVSFPSDNCGYPELSSTVPYCNQAATL